MATIIIPTNLQKTTNEQKTLAIQAIDMGDLSKQLEEKFPELYAKLFGEDRLPLRFVKIFVDNQLATENQLRTLKFAKDAKVQILFALAGG